MIVFCITCKNRTQHLKQTLPKNLSDNRRAKFVVLNYNTSDDLVEYISSKHDHELAIGKLVLYTHLNEPVFRMAHAKNMAHQCAILEHASILVNLDADNLTGSNFDEYLLGAFSQRKDIFLYANVVKGEAYYNGTVTNVSRGLAGRIALIKEAFIRTGGYDEAKFNGWGSDDKDLNIRLRMAGYDGFEINPIYLSGVPHNNKIRFKEYPHLAAQEDSYFRVDRSTVTSIVANNSLPGAGLVYKNLDFKHPISLPQRIFGIGLHKTATTSLHHALEILGYSSWHWTSAHAAKAIWQETTRFGRSKTLDQYQAASDLPIPMLYKQLDEAYPGSKFILTTRDDKSWLDACRRHFKSASNKWRDGWDDDPFTHRVHTLLYGQKDFDANVFLTRYRRHNAEVQDYFRDRPSDLLVMNMSQNAGWRELCEFLGNEKPDVAYPSANNNGGSK